jgi:hypothetical protein
MHYKSAEQVREIYKEAGSRLRQAVKVVQHPEGAGLMLNGKQIGALHLSPDNQIIQAGIADKYKGMGLYTKLLGETTKARGTLHSGGELSGPAAAGWARFSKNAPVTTHPEANVRRWKPEHAEHPFWSQKMKWDGRRVGDISGASTGSTTPVFSIKKPDRWTR